MCNDYRLLERIPAETLFARLLYPEGIPNFEPREDIRITDRAPILRAATGAISSRVGSPGDSEIADSEGATPGAVELVQRRWSWPGPGGKPVYNFRSEGRELPPNRRCLILADGFYEFTAHSDPRSKRKHKWLFTLKDRPWFGIAGLWRNDATVGEAFTMLTAEPNEDVAPYHNRGIVVLTDAGMARWLDPAVPARDVLRPLPAGSLVVTQVA